MALSFGVGYSSDLRNARERLKKKRLENKKVFEDWLSEKREAGEAVTYQELEEKKFDLSGGDSLYSDMIGNEAVLQNKTFRHNKVVADKILSEAGNNMQVRDNMVKLWQSNMNIKDKDFEQYQERVAKLFGGGDIAKGKLIMIEQGITSDWWTNESKKLYENRASELMATAKWGNVMEEADINKIFPEAHPDVKTILRENIKGQVRRERADGVKAVLNNVATMTIDDRYIDYGNEAITNEIKILFQAQGIKNPTEAEVKQALDVLLARQKSQRSRKLGSFNNAFAEAFYNTGYLKMLQASPEVLPTNDQLQKAIVEAMGAAGFPEWASTIEGYSKDTIMKDGQWAAWIEQALGKDWSKNLRKGMYDQNWQNAKDENEEQTKAALDAMGSESASRLALIAQNKNLYGNTFTTDKEGKNSNGVGSGVLVQLSSYYVPEHQAQAVVNAIHREFKENANAETMTVLTKIKNEFDLQTMSDWKTEQSNKIQAYDADIALAPNTDLPTYFDKAASTVSLDIVKEAQSTVESLPKNAKIAGTNIWMRDRGFYKIRDKAVATLEEMKRRIQTHTTGDSMYAFINTNPEGGFEITLGNEKVRVHTMEEGVAVLNNYIDEQIAYLKSSDFASIEPTGTVAQMSFSNPDTANLATNEVLNLSGTAQDYGWQDIGGGNALLVKGNQKHFEPNPAVYDKINDRIVNSWWTAQPNGQASNGAVLMDIYEKIDAALPYDGTPKSETRRMEAFRNIILFQMEAKGEESQPSQSTKTTFNNAQKGSNLSQAKLGGASLDYGVGLYGKQFLIRLYNRTRAEVENMRENQQ